jgi:tripartite-type tricarboxylate transporter receptor subunit TctC
MAPTGTPRPVLDRLSSEVNKIVNSPEVKEAWAKQGAAPMGMSVDDFDKFLRGDIQKWAKLVKDTGMKVD